MLHCAEDLRTTEAYADICSDCQWVPEHTAEHWKEIEERFADLGLTTDGAYWARWCRRHERLLAEQAAHRACEAKKPKRVLPNPWVIGGDKETPDFRMLLLGP